MTSWLPSRIAGRVIALGVALLALGGYLFTLSSGPYPGRSANLLVAHLGLMPNASPASPVWHLCLYGVQWVPVGTFSLRANLLSAVFAAAAVFLLCRLVTRWLSMLMAPVIADRPSIRWVPLVCGACAGLCLAFSMPFWHVANRADPAALDVLLMLVLGSMFLGIWQGIAEKRLCLFAFLYGVAVTEYATMIILAPCFVFGTVYSMWRQGFLRWGVVMRVTLSGLAGLGVYLVNAWLFFESASYEIMKLDGFWAVVLRAWREQYALISRSLPAVGWLLVVFTAIAPGIVCLLVARRGLTHDEDWTYTLLHLVSSVLVLCVVVNAEIAPWAMLGDGLLLVAPYVMTAATLAYLVAYWLLYGMKGAGKDAVTWKSRIRQFAGVTLAAIGLVVTVAMPFVNAGTADARTSGPINRLARDFVEGRAGREWIVTDGVLDKNMLILAFERGESVKLLNQYGAGDWAYMSYVARLLDRRDLAGLSSVGVIPVLREWQRTDPAFARNVALMTTPNLWVGAGIDWFASRGLYLGTLPGDLPDWEVLMAEHRGWWERSVPGLRRLSEGESRMNQYADYYLRQIAKSANNLGYVMEAADKPELAFECYSKAREIDEDNVSALLNMHIMVRSGFDAPARERVLSEFEDFKKESTTAGWRIAEQYGYVRTPEMFLSLGWTWALSGSPESGARGLEEALTLRPDMLQHARLGIARMHQVGDSFENSEKIYRQIIAEDPSSSVARIGLADVLRRQGRFSDAMQQLEQIKGDERTQAQASLQQAVILLQLDRLDDARAILMRLSDQYPDEQRVWAFIADVASRQQDGDLLEATLGRLRAAPRKSYMGFVALGQAALMAQDIRLAAEYYEEALRLRPNSKGLIEELIKLDMRHVKRDSARDHVRKLLNIDAGNAFGNMILGTLQLYDGDLELAEASFRKSLERKVTPNALNDLAWVLCENARYKESEKFIRQALELDDTLYAAWDTLGVALMRTGRTDGAEESFRKSIACFSGDPAVRLHLLELYVEENRTAEARDLLSGLAGSENTLSAAQLRELAELRKAIERLEG